MLGRKGWIEDGVGYIPLTKGLVTIVDPDMVPVLEQWNWFAKVNGQDHDHYAGRHTLRSIGPQKYVPMARVILGMDIYDKSVFPDHKNGNKLDNRRTNLRVATHTENMRNRRVQDSNPFGLKGVCFDKRKNWYYARMRVNGRQIHLGCRRTAQEAHELYCAKAKELYGDFFRAG